MYFEGQKNNQATKILQSYYRQQLDSQMAHRQQLKNQQKNKKEEERRLYNERMNQQDELEKMKDLSYKNYYQMVMNSQDTNMKSYGEDIRGSVKEQFISSYEGEGKFVNEDLQRQKRKHQIKNQYRNDLLQQLKDKELKKQMEKHRKQEERVIGQRIIQQSRMYTEQQKIFNKQYKQKYKSQLDKLIAQNKINQSAKPLRQRERRDSQTSQSQIHNVISNPLPYRIQNPYILRQMQRNNNKSYLATIANTNLYN